MAAKGKVEFILTADDAKAVQAATKLLEKVRETGVQFDQTGRKQKTMFDDLTSGATKFITQFGTFAGASKVVADALDQIKQRIDAIVQAQGKAAEVSRSYGQNLREIFVNMPTAGTADYQNIDALLRRLSTERALGDGGLNKLALGYANITTSVPNATPEMKAAAANEMARMLEFSPTQDPVGTGVGIAKILEGAKGTLNAEQALNILRVQQEKGMVPNVGGVGASIPTLANAAVVAGQSLPEMQGLWAYLTQRTGDREGAETTSALSGMVTKIMTRGATITGKLGMEEELTGPLFSRLQKISDVYQSGLMSEEEVGKLLPDLTRSEKAKLATLQLLGGEMPLMLDQFVAPVTSASALPYSTTQRNIEDVNRALPTEAAHSAARRRESQKEARRAGDADSAFQTELRAEYEAELKARKLGAKFEGRAMAAYDARRYMGDDEQAARAFGSSVAGLGRVPLAGPVLAGIATGEAQAQGYARDLTGYRGGNVVELMFKYFTAATTPRRPLKETGAR